MGSSEDSRKAAQDFLAPDLKALTVRLGALEKEMHAGFAHAEKMNCERVGSVKTETASGFAYAGERLNAVKTEMASGFAHAEERLNALKTEMVSGFAHAEKMNLERFSSAAARHEALLATIAANHSSIMSMLEFDKRLTRIESERKAEPPHA